MKKSTRLTIILAAVTAVSILDMTTVFSNFSKSQSMNLLPTAEARVGRPLTPVSFAGVARRTYRRCAAGVYYC